MPASRRVVHRGGWKSMGESGNLAARPWVDQANHGGPVQRGIQALQKANRTIGEDQGPALSA
jgi:hypothetical protein